MEYLVIYLFAGVVVLVVGVSKSPRGIGGGTPAADLAVAAFVVVLWPICVFALGGRE